MVGPILSVMLLFSLGYFGMFGIAGKIRAKTSIDFVYHFKTDVTIYLLVMMFIGALGVYFLIPDFSDYLVPMSVWKIVVPFLCAGLIYGSFLFGIKYLPLAVVVFSSFICGFLLVDSSSLVFEDVLSPFWEIFCLSVVAMFISLTGFVLIGIHGLLSLYVLMILTGIILISFVGGLPLYFALTAAFFAGIWAVIYQNNKYNENLRLNVGSALSVTFLVGCLFLCAVNELSFSSIFILAAYPLVEFVWAVVGICFLKNESPDFYMYTAFYNAYMKDVDVITLYTLLFKLLMMNILFALVQLYASNMFTIPVLTLVFNFWMLSKFYHSEESEMSFKEAGQKLIEDVKEQMEILKNKNKKD